MITSEYSYWGLEDFTLNDHVLDTSLGSHFLLILLCRFPFFEMFRTSKV
jgi:hypothetical protein